MSWITDENDTIETKTFYGDDCLKQFGLFLYDNIKIFDDYTFYAHNTGKFDQLLFFREFLLTDYNKDKL